ncbi:transmembrane protein 97 [Iris pallida]|uniref:Transmembrane protein 97 n=1 Tax=Iris pallida TaxID=29817 RepID=A0AAX6FIA2_IRIPA|nr:transmembrane protein 97 [Iris pallida]
MGLISGLVDLILLVFSVVLLLSIPLIDAQVVLPPRLFPSQLLELKQWYREEFGDYLMGEKPHFFVGLVWVEILLLWPLSLANVIGILRRKGWAGRTLLMVGVSTATSMTTIMAELLGSGRASEKLLQMYTPFAAFSVLAILRGLFPRRRHSTHTSASHASSARKKRA